MTETARDPLLDVRPGDRWLVAGAHPDDETFGCGSAIARATTRGAEVTVVCATRGEAGERVPGSADGADLGTVREGELRRAAVHLGVGRVELLGYRDSGFDGDLDPGSLCAAPLDEVAATLDALLGELQPQVVLTLDGSDGHRDHLHIGAAAPLGVAPHDGPLLVEQCLPNSLLRRWLDEMRAVRPDTAYHSLVRGAQRRAAPGVPDRRPSRARPAGRSQPVATSRRSGPRTVSGDRGRRLSRAEAAGCRPSNRRTLEHPMTRDGTVLDALSTDAIPAPRTAVRSLPWLEPGQFARGTRPRAQYWDVGTARWVSRSPVPGPRRGD